MHVSSSWTAAEIVACLQHVKGTPAVPFLQKKEMLAEGSRQGHFFDFALYLDRSRDARPLGTLPGS
jgi:hypothetical protein